MLNFKHGNISNQVIGIPLILFIILYLTISNNGLLKYILNTKTNIYLSNISFECYLIHYVLFLFTKDYLQNYSYTYLGIFYIYTFLLITTIICSILYRQAYKFISTAK